MNLRLIFSDADGTILPEGGEISERTRAAAQAAVGAGVPFVITSGRWYVTAREISDALALTDGFMIVCNGGAAVQMDGTPLKEWTLDGGLARKIWDLTRDRPLMTAAFSRNAISRMNTRALGRPLKRPTGEFFGGKYRIVRDDRRFFEEDGLAAPYKMIVSAGPEGADALEAVCEALEGMDVALSRPGPHSIEIMPPGVGKGTAALWLAEYLGVDRADCMALGDNTNDLSLLEAVGWPVAVGNAVEPLKAVARILAPDCDADGAAQIIERALRGEL